MPMPKARWVLHSSNTCETQNIQLRQREMPLHFFRICRIGGRFVLSKVRSSPLALEPQKCPVCGDCTEPAYDRSSLGPAGVPFMERLSMLRSRKHVFRLPFWLAGIFVQPWLTVVGPAQK